MTLLTFCMHKGQPFNPSSYEEGFWPVIGNDFSFRRNSARAEPRVSVWFPVSTLLLQVQLENSLVRRSRMRSASPGVPLRPSIPRTSSVTWRSLLLFRGCHAPGLHQSGAGPPRQPAVVFCKLPLPHAEHAPLPFAPFSHPWDPQDNTFPLA